MSKQKLTQWEYWTEELASNAKPWDSLVVGKKLAELGDQGWEMVCLIGPHGAIFKRPKQDALPADAARVAACIT